MVAHVTPASVSNGYRIDEDLRKLLPPLTPAERSSLKASILAAKGCIHPVIVWREQHVLVDGHHRHELVGELRDEGHRVPSPKVVLLSFPDKFAVVQWMFEHQTARRNWTPANRAAAVLRNRELVSRLREQASQRMRCGRKLAAGTVAGPTRRFLAKLAGVGEGTVAAVDKVLSSGNEDAIRKLLIENKWSVREAKAAVRRTELQSVYLNPIAAVMPSGVVPTVAPSLDLIIHDDVLDGLSRVKRGSVALAFTSPPYPLKQVRYQRFTYNGDYDAYVAWLESVWRAVISKLKPNGRLVVNVDNPGNNGDGDVVRPLCADVIAQLRHLGLRFMGDIVWYKQNAVGRRTGWGTYGSCSNPRLRRNHEYLLVFSYGSGPLEGDKGNCDLTPKEFEAWTLSTWYVRPERRNFADHPAVFPEHLAERVIKLLSYRGDIVLDPFCGVGTVPLVAKKLGRRFVGIDNGHSYVAEARRRLALADNAGTACRPCAPTSRRMPTSLMRHVAADCT